MATSVKLAALLLLGIVAAASAQTETAGGCKSQHYVEVGPTGGSGDGLTNSNYTFLCPCGWYVSQIDARSGAFVPPFPTQTQVDALGPITCTNGRSISNNTLDQTSLSSVVGGTAGNTVTSTGSFEGGFVGAVSVRSGLVLDTVSFLGENGAVSPALSLNGVGGGDAPSIMCPDKTIIVGLFGAYTAGWEGSARINNVGLICSKVKTAGKN